MTMMRWTPFREMTTLSDRLNRLLEDRGELRSQPRWHPPVDIFEDEAGIEMTFELPGLDQEEIDIQVSGEVLTVSGKREPPTEGERGAYRRLERPSGEFRRSFSLPDRVEAQKISARFEDGVLRLVLPRAEETKPKKISVEIG